MKYITFVTFAVFSQLSLPQFANAAPEKARQTLPARSAVDSVSFSLKRLEEVPVVYLERRGYYWSLGAWVSELEAATVEIRPLGPMFVRYHSDPEREPLGQFDVGFALSQKPTTVAEPLCAGVIENALYAVAVVPNQTGNLLAVQHSLHEWIAHQGLLEVGPAIEWHDSPSNAQLGKNAFRLQIPVRVSPTPKRLEERLSDETPEVVRPTPNGERASKSTHSETSTDTHHVPSHEVVASKTSSDSESTSGRKEDSTKAYSLLEREGAGSLVRGGRFREAGDAMTRFVVDEPVESLAWLCQISFRISALARGAKQLGEPVDLTDLSIPLDLKLLQEVARRGLLWEQLVNAPLATAPKMGAVEAEPTGASKAIKILGQGASSPTTPSPPDAARLRQQVIRDLDRLLGDVAFALRGYGAIARNDVILRLGTILDSAEPWLATGQDD